MFDELKLKFRLARMTANQVTNSMEKLMKDERGESPVKALLGLFIVAILAGALVPVGISALHGANQTGWTSSEVATYAIISILVIIGTVMLLVRLATE